MILDHHDGWKHTSSDKAACSPLFGPLLNHLKQILAIVIVSNQVSTVDNEDKRWRALLSSGESNLLKLIEGSFDI